MILLGRNGCLIDSESGELIEEIKIDNNVDFGVLSNNKILYTYSQISKKIFMYEK